MAILVSPVVIASKAVDPTAILNSAVSVVPLGSFPIYIEKSSTSASEILLTLKESNK